jgi:hypothetical protein
MPVNATAIDEPKGIQAPTKPTRPTKQEGASQAVAPAAILSREARRK